MNFFEAQARARRRTGWLLVLFTLAVGTLITLTNLLVMAVMSMQRGHAAVSQSVQPGFDWGLFGLVSLGTLAVIGVGSLYKTLALSGGGSSVAEMLGGRLIPNNTTDPAQRRLLNVVEEMAIASGSPKPSVYLLDEPGINAFAAGRTPNDAVIGVTQGTLDALDRDELQGVIAHEFSHIFNGDMRMNIRLMGVLHGILLIGLAGYYLLRSVRHVGSSRSRDGAGLGIALLGLGAGLWVIGYTGFFFGQWIKATVSRQREYLADASAVQFTRNPGGIAGALKKTGATSLGSMLHNPGARQFSHALFAAGFDGFLESLFATHPPLDKRIRRVEPRWDGKFVVPITRRTADEDAEAEARASKRQDTQRRATLASAVLAGVLTPDDAVAAIGHVDEQQVDLGRKLLAAIPAGLRQAAEEPRGARAVVCGLLLDPAPDMRARQQAMLAADPALPQLVADLDANLRALPAAARLSLVGLTLPTLRSLSTPQYERFRSIVVDLINADNKISLNEWVMRHFLMRQLDQHFGLRPPPKGGLGMLGDVNQEAALIVSLVAHTEHADPAEAERAFQAGIRAAEATALKFVPREQLRLDNTDTALDRLAQLRPLLKPRILKACAACIMQDGRITVRGEDILRTVASCLDSPMPPITGIRD